MKPHEGPAPTHRTAWWSPQDGQLKSQ